MNLPNTETVKGTTESPSHIELDVKMMPPTLLEGDDIKFRVYEPEFVEFNFTISHDFYCKVLSDEENAKKELKRIFSDMANVICGDS